MSSVTLMKTSAIRGVKAKIIEQMPNSAPILDTILPKKSSVYTVKW